ncbi:MAG: GtrA family protein [Eubacterium sp.]|nr:GtrA family protein [Eubacterium sp.]
MDLFRKYKSFILYVIFGILTTLVNVAAYGGCLSVLHINNTYSNITAWIASVSFAYFTNRKWVFESKANGNQELFREVISFYSCRLLTGFLDLAIMILFVDFLEFHPLIMKCISNIIVILANYIASKRIIFH